MGVTHTRPPGPAGAAASPTIRPVRRDRTFWALIAAAGVFRIVYVLTAKLGQPVAGDEIYYSGQAEMIAAGRWFAHPFEPDSFAADHVPLTSLAVAPVSWMADPLLWQRLLMALYGTAVVALIGALAWRLAGRRVGLIATSVAGVYANLWMNDGLVMAETLAAGGVAAVLWFAYAVHGSVSVRSIVALGVAVGVATLARAEMLGLLAVVAVPMVWLATRGRSGRSRVQAVLTVVVATVTVLAPWVGRNLVRFEETTLLSAQDGYALLGANCARSYFGQDIGFWSAECGWDIATDTSIDQSERSAIMRDQAVAYISDNLDRVPVVVAARVARGLSLWRPDVMAWVNTGEGREVWAGRVGYVQFWLLAPLAVVGLARWRSAVPRWPLVVTAATSLALIAGLYGIPRFRIAAEVVIVIGAAIALDRWFPVWLRRRSAG